MWVTQSCPLVRLLDFRQVPDGRAEALDIHPLYKGVKACPFLLALDLSLLPPRIPAPQAEGNILRSPRNFAS